MAVWNAQFISLYVWLLSLQQQQGPGQGITFVDLNKGEPQVSFFTFIIGAFKFIGLAILFMAAVGILTGFFRIWVRRRFPDNRLNGIDVEAMTHLHLNEHSETPNAPAADA
jgi:hypothetical protein